jgi:hypothetical protein
MTQAAPSATLTPTPSPEPTLEPGPPATLVIGASGVTVLDDHELEVASADYAEGVDDVVAVLSAALGDPVRKDVNACGPATHFRWGGSDGVQLINAGTAGVDLELTSRVADYDGIAIESAPGPAVGDDVTQLISDLPASQILADYGSLIWEVTGKADGLPVGGVIYYSTEGQATQILAPGNFYSDNC